MFQPETRSQPEQIPATQQQAAGAPERFAAVFARHPAAARRGPRLDRRVAVAFGVVVALVPVAWLAVAVPQRWAGIRQPAAANPPQPRAAAGHAAPSAPASSAPASSSPTSAAPLASQPFPAPAGQPAGPGPGGAKAGPPAAPPAGPPAAHPPPATGPIIVGHQSGKCLTATADRDGQPLVLRTCNGSSTQRWRAYGDGTIRTPGGRCMDAAWGSVQDGTIIQVANCNGNPAQQFTLNSSSDLVDRQADKCVDVAGQLTGDGSRIVLWPCNGRDNQKWSWA